MDIERHIEVRAPAELVWGVMTDVERWPEWTASVRSVELLDCAELEVGRRARVRQPRLPVATYTVSVLEPGRYFEWESAAAGVRTVAGHRVTAIGDGTARVALTVDWRGPFAPLVRLLYGRLSRRYVQMEAQGLKQRCEARATSAAYDY